MCAARLGGLDVLVNNAGIAGPTAAIEDIDPADWRRCIDIDLTGQFLCARRAVPMLKAAGGGAIVNMSSAAGRLRLRLPHPLCGRQVGRDRLDPEPGQGARPPQHHASTRSCRASSPGPRIEGVIGARAEQLGLSYRGDGAPVSGEGLAAPDGDSAQEVAAMVLFLVSPLGRGVSGQSLGVCGNVETL